MLASPLGQNTARKAGDQGLSIHPSASDLSLQLCLFSGLFSILVETLQNHGSSWKQGARFPHVLFSNEMVDSPTSFAALVAIFSGMGANVAVGAMENLHPRVYPCLLSLLGFTDLFRCSCDETQD